MRIQVVANYPLEKMRALADAGVAPAQHAWATDALGLRHTVAHSAFTEPADAGAAERLSALLRWRFGQLRQEWEAVRAAPDVVYAADERTGAALGMVPRRVRPWRLVTVVHHPITRGRLSGLALGGVDLAVCLSPAAASVAAQRGVRRHVVARWGPDLGSGVYQQERDESAGIVSTGKSNRDLGILVRALDAHQQAGVVFAGSGQVEPHPQSRVRLAGDTDADADPAAPGAFLARSVIGWTARASVVAVPVRDPDRLTGLTEVNDALALGKPVVMTRSPYFPFSVSEVGCGIEVEPGDEKGWRDALALMAEPQVRAEMGARGRRFAESAWNYGLFCDDVVSAVESA
jgi:glycosyltransferase involved in cell wall biosynthesis